MGPFASQRKRVARAACARLLGYGLVRLQPGQRPCAYHFHHVNEEWFYVRSGYGRLRTADGEWGLRPGDAFGCPAGADGVHGLVNSGDTPLEYFALSTMEEPEVVVYPDSDKVYAMVGAAPGGNPDARSVDLIVRRRDAVAYEEGEP